MKAEEAMELHPGFSEWLVCSMTTTQLQAAVNVYLSGIKPLDLKMEFLKIEVENE